jgi:glutaredoxin
MSDLEIILYTRLGCHLCDDAKALLESYGLMVRSVNIDGDPVLVDRFGLCVPVVFIDGRERFRGRIDPVLLRRLLDRHP